MSAQPDAATRRHWRQSNPARPGDRLVYATLTCWRSTILAQRFEIHAHAEERMAERRIGLDQLLSTVRDGRIIPCSQLHVGDDIYGGFLAADLMVVVGAFCPHGVNFYDLVPTVRTLYRTAPLDLAQPLTMPLRELARLQP